MAQGQGQAGMAGNYLRAFSERVGDVPSYLKRHLALIRDLDEKVQALQKEIELHSKRKLAAGEAGASKRQRMSESGAYDVDSAVTRLLSLADEKVNIAAQVYDFIDKHIQHLDEDLKALGQEIELEKAPGAPPVLPAAAGELVDAAAAAAAAVKGTAAAGKVKGSKSKAGTGKQSKKAGSSKAGAAQAAAAAAATFPAPALAAAAPFYLTSAPNEHEPLYCYCQRPSHGQMVACDNDECPYEWYHYECVGLTEEPPKDQEWFCPDCAPKMKARRAAQAALAVPGAK